MVDTIHLVEVFKWPVVVVHCEWVSVWRSVLGRDIHDVRVALRALLGLVTRTRLLSRCRWRRGRQKSRVASSGGVRKICFTIYGGVLFVAYTSCASHMAETDGKGLRAVIKSPG